MDANFRRSCAEGGQGEQIELSGNSVFCQRKPNEPVGESVIACAALVPVPAAASVHQRKVRYLTYLTLQGVYCIKYLHKWHNRSSKK